MKALARVCGSCQSLIERLDGKVGELLRRLDTLASERDSARMVYLRLEDHLRKVSIRVGLACLLARKGGSSLTTCWLNR